MMDTIRNASVTELKGIGPKKAELFEKLNVRTVDDLLHLFPRTYRQYPAPIPLSRLSADGKYPQTAVCVRLQRTPVLRKTARMDLVIARGFEEGETVDLYWFRTPYVIRQLPTGTPLVFYGTLQTEKGRRRMDQPEIFLPSAYENRMRQPLAVYPLTAGLTNNTVRSAVALALEEWKAADEPLPEALRTRRGLMSESEAIRTMHLPDSMDSLTDARRRLVYEEFLLFLLCLRSAGDAGGDRPNAWPMPKDTWVPQILSRLPYALTAGQRQALEEIRADLAGLTVSQRLLQGDVGSGKTIVAFCAMAMAAENGYQAALMVPTEVLARQHESTFRQLCAQAELDVPVVCLTGADTAARRREIRICLETSEGALIIGTQALIQNSMSYARLALVVADEQHRFGVRQRSLLTEKGKTPHLLVMSATPIPRTMAMILYGQMHLSVISELPKNRLPVKTAVIREQDRPKADRFLRKEVAAGHQCYIICPLVEASEDLTEAENVTDYAKTLSGRLGSGIRVDLLHGRMKTALKEAAMERFVRGETDILVSTTVVEVGINVPNATVMLIENADRFGLAQLHQLRGRVGRGAAQSYCILMDTSDRGPEGNERLRVLAQSADGFAIAWEDLKLRGPGDFLGVRQSGEMGFALGDIFLDADVLSEAADDCEQIRTEDSALELPQHQALRNALERMKERNFTVL